MMLDRQIHIYNYTEVRNTYGEVRGKLTKFATLMANVNYRGGREGFYARQVVATENIVFKIRYYPGIKETMFIEYSGKMYDIRHIAENGRNRFLEITAEMHDNMSVPVEEEQGGEGEEE